jgi:hypothetical protein
MLLNTAAAQAADALAGDWVVDVVSRAKVDDRSCLDRQHFDAHVFRGVEADVLFQLERLQF